MFFLLVTLPVFILLLRYLVLVLIISIYFHILTFFLLLFIFIFNAIICHLFLNSITIFLILFLHICQKSISFLLSLLHYTTHTAIHLSKYLLIVHTLRREARVRENKIGESRNQVKKLSLIMKLLLYEVVDHC